MRTLIDVSQGVDPAVAGASARRNRSTMPGLVDPSKLELLNVCEEDAGEGDSSESGDAEDEVFRFLFDSPNYP